MAVLGSVARLRYVFTLPPEGKTKPKGTTSHDHGVLWQRIGPLPLYLHGSSCDLPSCLGSSYTRPAKTWQHFNSFEMSTQLSDELNCLNFQITSMLKQTSLVSTSDDMYVRTSEQCSRTGAQLLAISL